MNVFITGGTGFLGTELVKKLVGEGHLIYLFARSNMKARRLLETFSANEQKHIIVIEGNLNQENLGISNEDISILRGKIDVIYHTAAFLSFNPLDKEQIFEVNVAGTKNVLDFGKLIQVKKFIYISTAYTLGLQNIGKEELYPLDSLFVNNYEESKCHAEHLVMSHSENFAVTIMRPSIIIGHSKTGEANTTFGLYGILKTVEFLKRRAMKLNEQPTVRLLINKQESSNIVPIDYVIDTLVLGLKCRENQRIFHITNPHPPKNELVFEIIKEVFDYPSLQICSINDASNLSDFEKTMNKPLQVFQPYLNRTISFNDDHLQQLLKENGLEPLNLDIHGLYRIINGYSKKEFIYSN